MAGLVLSVLYVIRVKPRTGTSGLSQCFDDVDVEYEPAVQLLSFWIRIILVKPYFRFDAMGFLNS